MTLKALENPPDYIRLYLVDIHQNLPDTIRNKIGFVNINADSMTWRQRFLSFRDIVRLYWETFPKARRVPELPLLANLFWIVTQRVTEPTGSRRPQQDEQTPYWGVHRFNYAIIIGNLPVGAAEHCWSLLDSDRVPVGIVIDLARVVKHVATRTARPVATVFEEAVAHLAALDAHDVTWRGGVPLNWDQGVEDLLCVHFGLPPMAPKGQRKGKRRVVTLGTPKTPEAIPAPPPAPPAPKPVMVDRPRVVQPLSKGADADEIREAVNSMVDAATEGLNAGDRARVRTITQAHLNDMFSVMATLVRKYHKETKERDGARAAALARNERVDYERAVKFFGFEAPAGGLADLAPIKRLFRQQSQDLHPDHNPGRESIVGPQFTEMQEKYATIRDYHAKQEERKAS